MDKPVRGGNFLLLGTVLLVQLVSAQAETLSVERQQELRNMLFQDCGSCHGLKMTGGLGPALTQQALKGKNRSYLLAAILDGRRDTPMPPWRGIINQTEAEWMLDLLYRGAKYEQ